MAARRKLCTLSVPVNELFHLGKKVSSTCVRPGVAEPDCEPVEG